MTIPNEPVKFAMTPIHDRPLENYFQNNTRNVRRIWSARNRTWVQEFPLNMK